jgi:hypothetical protein
VGGAIWIRRRWRRVLAIVVILVLVVASLRALDHPSPIDYYRVIDDQTLSVGTVEGHGAWTRVTALDETPTTVTITVGSFLFQLGPGTAEGLLVATEVKLHDPIGDRSVIDGSSGLSVRRATCPPPAYFASQCP